MITYNYQNIIKISAPLVLGMLVQVLVGITDTAFLGHVGKIELGASAIGGILYLLIFMIIQSLSVGSQIIMARRNGEKRYNKIAHVFYQCLNIIILFSILCIVAIKLWAPIILKSIIESSLVLDAVLIYLLTRSLGFFFSGAKSVFRAFFIAITDTTSLLPAAIILLVSNIIFDRWLIFGGLGITPMGLKGAAIASVLAEICAIGYLILYTITKINLRKYGFNKFLLWKQKLFNEIFELSIWIVIQNALSWGAWLYFFIEIEKLGETSLAISNIIRSVSNLPFIFANALSVITSSIVSNLIGASKSNEVMATARRIFILGLLPYYGTLLFIGILPQLFLRIYTDDPVLIQESIAPLFSMLLAYSTALPALIYFYCIYGTGKTKVALIIEVLCLIFYIITIRVSVGVLRLDLKWCWLAELSYYLVLLPISYWYMKCNRWNNKTI